MALADRNATVPGQSTGGYFPVLSAPPRDLIVPSTDPVPVAVRVRLPWAYFTGLVPSAGGAVAALSYRLNGPYDPDTGAGGTSARGFAFWAAAYKYQICYHVDMQIEFSNPGADGVWVGYRLRQSADTTSNGGVMASLQSLPWCIFTPMNKAGEERMKYRVGVPIYRVLGLQNQDRLFENPSLYGATVSAVPTIQAYVDVCIVDTTAGTNGASFTVTLTYHTRFYDRIPPT